MATSPIILIFLVLSALYAVTKSIYTRINRHQKARALGCLAPKKAPSGFLGWTAYKRGIEAARAFQILDLMWKIHLEHGNTFQRTVLGTSAIVTTEPENIKAILATKFNDFSLGQRNRAFYPLLGDGIFTLDGAGWSHSRTMLRPQFSREQIADVGMLGKHVDQLIALIPRDGSAFDIQDLFFRLTLDTATEFLFGESANSLAVEGHGHAKSTSPGGGALACISDDQDFAEAFNRSLDYLAARTRAQRLYWLVNSSESRKTIKTIHDIVDYYVDKALARRVVAKPSSSSSPSSASSSSASKYIFLDAMVSETQDRKTLRDQMLHLLLAGRDTTASLLSSSFFYLSRHPRVWERLREDILAVFPPPSSFSSSSSSSAKLGDDDNDVDITIARLREVRYLRHFLNEVLRLVPPVPLNSRWAVTDTSLPVGGGPEGKSPVFIHKGQRVMYMINNMHRRRDLWGDDALEFRPERWQGKQGGGGWEYLPFNGGPRICLGQQYALTEASYVLVRLLRRFESVENAQPEIVKPRIRFSLTASHAFGVKVKLFGGEK